MLRNHLGKIALASAGSGIGLGTYYYKFKKTPIDHIIVGGGNGGCITAYFLAKWKEDNNIPGKVVLLEAGDPYMEEYPRSNSIELPKPDMWSWYDNWENFAIVHDTSSNDGSFEPPIGSSHIGLGGCSTHDTRITFTPTPEQSERMASAMGWTKHKHDMYIQSVLDMIPIQSANCGEIFYDNVIQMLSDNNILNEVEDNEYKTKVLYDTISYVSIAMFPDETRWTGAYLLDKSIKPSNLDVITNFFVDKVIFDDNKRAIGVLSSDKRHIEIYDPDNSEVIIMAGSLGTPAILQRSGIGPSHHLKEMNIPVIVSNDEVGHGVDHIEVPVMYKWLEKWNEKDGTMPRGGPMAWPLAIFSKLKDNDGFERKIMCHFGISPPPYGGNEVTATPNCTNPDPKDGFRCYINSLDPKDPIILKHSRSDTDFKTLALGTKEMVKVFDKMQNLGLVGERVEPPKDLNLNNDEELDEWIGNNLGTAYHWMSTCKAGTDTTRVVDENFKVRGVKNLRVGSGAVLPEIPDANPHLTIAAYSVALADSVLNDCFLKKYGRKHNFKNVTTSNTAAYLANLLFGCKTSVNELDSAYSTLKDNNGELKIRRFDEVTPDVRNIAKIHANAHKKD